MPSETAVYWHQGMLLQPQHLQLATLDAQARMGELIDALAPDFWGLAAAREFQLWRAQAAAQAAAGDALAAVGTVGMRALRRGTEAGPGGAALSVEHDLHGVRSLRDYLSALDRLARALEQDEAQAGAIAAAHAAGYAAAQGPSKAGEAATDPGPSVTRDVLRARQLLREHLHDALPLPYAADEAMIDALLDAPWRSLMRYAQATAACRLQRQWRADVLWPLQTTATREDKLQQLYGPQGTLWSFVDGPAAPFLRRDALRYRPVVAAGESSLFSAEFLDLLNRAALRRAQLQLEQQAGQQRARARDALLAQLQASTQQLREQHAQLEQQREALLQGSHTVALTALPSDIEPIDAPRVHDTRLSLECSAGSTHLDNPNLPQTRAFAWNPRACASVRLRIAIDGVELERVYAGALGFADFLEEFRGGSHAFRAEEFAQQAPRLRELGVRRITLHYRIDGADGVLHAADALRRADARDLELARELRDLEQQRQRLLQPPGTGAGSPAPVPVGEEEALALPSAITACPEDEVTPRGAT